MNDNDTIAAVATAPGRGAVGIVRMSGPLVPALATQLLGRLPPARVATCAQFRAADGTVLDSGLALYFPAPHSFTGEHVLELQGHGGSVVTDLLLERLLQLGCRLAQPGEFTERAFHNDKLDLAQAEGIADLIDATSRAAARAAQRTLRGEFSARVTALDAALKHLRMYVEAAIDFPEEEVDFLNDAQLDENLRHVFEEFDALMRATRRGVALSEGLRVVLAGAPNVGKSSLMNALAGEDVAIVTAIPGTTRDVLRQSVKIDGFTVNLADTAGLRESADAIEREGMQRARREMAGADQVLLVLEAGGALPDAAELQSLPTDVPVTWVFNKIDVTGESARLEAQATPPRVYLSATRGQGVDLLRTHLASQAGLADPEEGAFTARRWHLAALEQARIHVDAAASTLRGGEGFELFAEELRLAQQQLATITGTYGSEELLSDIFRSFCIGK